MIDPEYDVIIAGGGFSGVYNLIHLTKLGLRCRLIEPGSALGGTWYWNKYPGARVDSDVPIYQFPVDDLAKGWTWSERFPDSSELRAYFAYVADKYDLFKYTWMESRVNAAHWNDDEHIWKITANGAGGFHQSTARFFIMAVGSTTEPYTPKFDGLASFQGRWCHSGRWPTEGIDVKNKRVGVIGTGASGVQIIQEIGPQVKHLTVFQRTPNLALPMVQYQMSRDVQAHFMPVYPNIFEKLPKTFGGFHFDFIPRLTMSDPPEVREAVFESIWGMGGFSFWLAGYSDLFFDKEAANEAYKFWQKKTSARIKDPRKRDLLAPKIAPHPFGTKRPCLEQRFYEVFNQENVDLIDIKEDPIVEITADTVKTKNTSTELDVLIVATVGWDNFTGPWMRMDLRGEKGKTIQEHWNGSAILSLGLTTDNFPNMFFLYGAHAPTAFCNGPTCIEVQGQWIVKTINHLYKNDITKFVPKAEAAREFTELIDSLSRKSLFHDVDSWYMGANVPGKRRQAYNWVVGLPAYTEEVEREVERGYPGFIKDTVSGVGLAKL
ncbi:cyclohexanone monooxygenase [Coniophora puteana RWD-64-598 SS2]|uniref:Cyclohexanone monooxygenase n=1 Tax=Coniophora puteana (strain RWD-64-598) TaxID=741705 RepID=A0A5M3MQH1_CONPW|nr:cyclohexanone monooxygenase [Coniophora puteana RWD-64-598 SS2]EIW80741.1 cyclohexanone monooxygenase [Coniophora puteana RWD-64-598 SS2]